MTNAESDQPVAERGRPEKRDTIIVRRERADDGTVETVPDDPSRYVGIRTPLITIPRPGK